MNIGVPKEIKIQEGRVGLLPAGAAALRDAGHQVLVESGAGLGCGFGDADYCEAGAAIGNRDEAWAQDLVVKVKEPQAEEFRFLRPGLTLFTYLHLAAERALTRALLDSGATALAYETVRRPDGNLPLLTPMSEIAGRMAVTKAAELLCRSQGGLGRLPGGVPGVAPARFVIVGSGVAGGNAAQMAVGLGAEVTVLGRNLESLRRLYHRLDRRIVTLHADRHTLARAVAGADVVIGCVLVPGAAAAKLISAAMIEAMQPGAVIIDISIDQGGCTELSRPTSHDQPTYRTVGGQVMYCVTNMPGAYPRTSAVALTNATLPHVLRLAQEGWRAAVAADAGLAAGVNVADGRLVNRPVAEALTLPFSPLLL
ncbi:MAG: alanine dehydrogenase [Desulfobulbaceae bacterium A2]|nr:MAG: alanine dehydrogenase [Desulfobulbaceae bacterium A2]